jgi:hypothetical protein
VQSTVLPTAPRSLWSVRFSIDQPVEITMSPPPTSTTGSEIPKKARMCDPMAKDATISIKLSIAMLRAKSLRVLGVYSFVSDRKMGLPPIGSTIGKSALTNRRILLAVCIISPAILEGTAYGNSGLESVLACGRTPYHPKAAER